MKDWDIGEWIVTAVIIVVAVLGLRSCSMSSGGGGGGGGGVDYEQYDSGPDCFAGPRGMECW
jgi:hypothetical protein